MGFADQRYTVNLSILFTELPLLQRPAAAAAAGFTAIELWWHCCAKNAKGALNVGRITDAMLCGKMKV
jgi:hydroxypyruvate isomerase